MKCEVTFDFLVELNVEDFCKKTGIDPQMLIDDIDSVFGDETLADQFSTSTADAKSGDIEVNDEYYKEPEYYGDSDELFAMFEAHYSVVVEGKTESACERKAQELFENADFGDYEYVDGCDCDRSCTVIDKDKEIEKE